MLMLKCEACDGVMKAEVNMVDLSKREGIRMADFHCGKNAKTVFRHQEGPESEQRLINLTSPMRWELR